MQKLPLSKSTSRLSNKLRYFRLTLTFAESFPPVKWTPHHSLENIMQNVNTAEAACEYRACYGFIRFITNEKTLEASLTSYWHVGIMFRIKDKGCIVNGHHLFCKLKKKHTENNTYLHLIKYSHWQHRWCLGTFSSYVRVCLTPLFMFFFFCCLNSTRLIRSFFCLFVLKKGHDTYM